MRVVFRADASVTIGTGHVMRCLTLADELVSRGAECLFVMRALPGHLGGFVEDRGYPVVILDAPLEGAAEPSGPPVHAAWAGVSWSQDLAEVRAKVAPADWLIVDHYAFDARWQRGMADTMTRIMVIDDLADRPHVGTLLLDQNLGREAGDYDVLVPDDCCRLIGPAYALLRPEFLAQRAISLERRKANELSHLMISMGGTDVVDATSTVLRILAGANLPDNLRFSVVMGKQAPALDRVRALAAEMPWPTEVLVDVRYMASLMASADLAIGAGGSTTWERCCLGLPGIIVETALNQAGAVRAMEEAGAAIGTGPMSDPAFGVRLVAAVEKSLDLDVSARLTRVSSELCSGDGVARVVQVLEKIA
jgi:UDP-2,4-diacetamido-2,4,6-trideoxy-beta-L-altropyranose hydrolase